MILRKSAGTLFSSYKRPSGSLSVEDYLAQKLSGTYGNKVESENLEVPDVGRGGVKSQPPSSPLPANRFRLDLNKSLPTLDELKSPMTSRSADPAFSSGLRFPVLQTDENYRYFKEKNLNRLAPKVFPIHVPTQHRVHPLLRHLIFVLHSFDPLFFSVRKIAERYAIKERTVEKILIMQSKRHFMRNFPGPVKNLQVTKDQRVMLAKERQYAKKVGYELNCNQDIDDERAIGEDFDGWTSTSDFIQLQSVQVEAFNAFPSPRKRNPVPKRVDVDCVVGIHNGVKVVQWIDPNDKLVF
jgi:hypothetical protein